MRENCGGLRRWECAPEELMVPFCQLYASCGVTLVPEFVAFTLRVCFLASYPRSGLSAELGGGIHSRHHQEVKETLATALLRE